ncbi:hypothetical protein FFLO_03725 [Filobasidium floriforme]|jgi:uncharacterized protein YbjT (DUF2867 family)|uniref:NmrA-like domain-containing protein n=1 Tax=Filobasidium floriforme TaxID=5210 RepID=A0A8K0NQH9_9TREE|nr:NmrA-like family protein [Filobasidium floriforme]KAG7532176.1 hypothetical protein FFLO_03725 [Filobasidium floriforme]KAH8081926.1 NmrA-like family protein [Filobasidium floriforme]
MSPTFLIVGATGNTGAGVTKTLAKELSSSPRFAQHRVIALTRHAESSTAKELASKQHVEVVEQDWTEITTKWLQDHEVERIFIASHNGPTQFSDESLFLTHALESGCVEYVVRISTTAGNIGPATKVAYARTHWAIETMLESPEFGSLGWTSLRPNVFPNSSAWVGDWYRDYKKTGKQGTLKMGIDKDAPLAPIDPVEVGIIAAKLLAQEDISRYNRQKYVLVGPENVTGKGVVELVEKFVGEKVENVSYRDTSFADSLKAKGGNRNLIDNTVTAFISAFDGSQSVEGSPTSPELLELYQLQHGAYAAWQKELEDIQG